MNTQVPIDQLAGGTPFSLEIRTGLVPINAGDTQCHWSFDTPMAGADYAVMFLPYPNPGASQFPVSQAPRLLASDLTAAGFCMDIADAIDCQVHYVAVRTTRNCFT